MIPQILLTFVSFLVQVLTFCIFARAIISWFPISPTNPLVVILNQITEPVLGPLRRVVPTMGAIDLTPLIAIVILQIVSVMVERLF